MARGTPPKHSRAGIVGAVVGLAAAGTAAGVAVSRIAARRVRAAELGPRASLATELMRADQHTEADLRENDPLGAASRAPDRTALVQTDDGVLLAVEEIGPKDAPLTVVFVHGYTLSMASWTFQRRTLAAELATATVTAPTPGWCSTTSAVTARPGGGRPSTRPSSSSPATWRGAGDAGAPRARRPRRALDGRHDDHGPGGTAARAVRRPRSSRRRCSPRRAGSWPT